MKTSTEGFQQCYNAQIAVDGTQQLIVAADLSAHPPDQGQLPAVLDQVEATVKQRPLTVLADAGYGNERDLARLETQGIEGYVAVRRDGRQAAGARPRPATARMAAKLATGDGQAPYTPPANGWPRPPTAGSNGSWDFARSACGASGRRRVNGTWCARRPTSAGSVRSARPERGRRGRMPRQDRAMGPIGAEQYGRHRRNPRMVG